MGLHFSFSFFLTLYIQPISDLGSGVSEMHLNVSFPAHLYCCSPGSRRLSPSLYIPHAVLFTWQLSRSHEKCESVPAVTQVVLCGMWCGVTWGAPWPVLSSFSVLCPHSPLTALALPTHSGDSGPLSLSVHRQAPSSSGNACFSVHADYQLLR